MYNHLLVPLDGSSFSENALPVALAIARRTGATVELIHVAPAPAPEPQHEMSTPAPAAGEPVGAYLHTLAASLSDRWDVAITVTIRYGPAVEQIYEHALASEADLLVMTTHGRSLLSRMFLGSVAQGLVRSLPLPVLLVRPSEAPVDLLESIHERVFTRILIPLDGSALSEEAVACAVELGTPMDAEYTLLQVIDFPVLGYAPGAVGLSDAVFKEWRDEAADYLERIAQDMRARGLRVRAVIVIAHPAVGILNYAHEHAVDLIAMGTHGRSGLAQALIGSVAEQVVRGAGVPVLVRRPQTMLQPPMEAMGQTAVDK